MARIVELVRVSQTYRDEDGALHEYTLEGEDARLFWHYLTGEAMNSPRPYPDHREWQRTVIGKARRSSWFQRLLRRRKA